MAGAFAGRVRDESESILTLFASFGEKEVSDELCNRVDEFLVGEEG